MVKFRWPSFKFKKRQCIDFSSIELKVNNHNITLNKNLSAVPYIGVIMDKLVTGLDTQ